MSQTYFINKTDKDLDPLWEEYHQYRTAKS